MRDDGSYGQWRDDPITKVIGPEHGGRTRAVTHVIGHTKVKGPYFKGAIRQKENADESTSFRGSSFGSDSSDMIYSDIQNVSECELLWAFGGRSGELVVATGHAYPTANRYLDDVRMYGH